MQTPSILARFVLRIAIKHCETTRHHSLQQLHHSLQQLHHPLQQQSVASDLPRQVHKPGNAPSFISMDIYMSIMLEEFRSRVNKSKARCR